MASTASMTEPYLTPDGAPKNDYQADLIEAYSKRRRKARRR